MGLMLGLLEGFAGLGMILALAEWFGVCALAPFVTRTGIPVSLGSLGGDLRAALASGGIRGFRTRARADGSFLIRPVLWFEREPSAAPFLWSLAVARPADERVQITAYLPSGFYVFAALASFVAVLRAAAMLPTLVLVVVWLLAVWWAGRHQRNEARLCFGRLAAAMPHNNQMQLTAPAAMERRS